MAKLQAPQLSSRLLRIALLWVILLITSVVYTLFLSWRLEATTAVLHDAADIRSELFQLDMVVKSPDLATKYDVPGCVWRVDRGIARVLRGEERFRILPKDDRINQVFYGFEELWKRNVKPPLLLEGGQETNLHSVINNAQFIVDFNRLNEQLDQWVTYVEADADRNIVILRYTQVALGALSVLSVIILMWFLLVWVLRPLNQLQQGIERLRQADWKTRVHSDGSLEFAHISTGFNDLASHLDDVYTNLENKVAEKTSSLAEKNVYLTALYGLTAYLSEQHSIEELRESFLLRIMTLGQAQAGAIYFWEEKRQRLELVEWRGLSVEQAQDPQYVTYFSQEMESLYPQTQSLDQVSDSIASKFKSVSTYHIRNKQKNIGVFVLFHQEGQKHDVDIAPLLETLGRHLGAAVENMRLTALDQQMAVGAERNLMAQNLHDSIAQTLSFVNLQVQMLDDAVKRNEGELIKDAVVQIKAGVQECYEDVRELLLNFRTRVTQEDFEEIAATVLKRFERQTQVKAHLRLLGNGLPLSSDQKLQAIFILQEALSNVRKHAHAETVLVTVRNEDDFSMTIMDDGVGIDERLMQERQQRHVGLSIMQERAQKVSGSIEIESESQVGTTVRFKLPKEVRQAL